MSLRKQAVILGITPSYLSMLVNGKRKWPDALRHRYEELVNSVVNTDDGSSRVAQTAHESARQPITSYKKLAGARGSRTHRPDRRAGANGFEVREAHQDPFAPLPQLYAVPSSDTVSPDFSIA